MDITDKTYIDRNFQKCKSDPTFLSKQEIRFDDYVYEAPSIGKIKNIEREDSIRNSSIPDFDTIFDTKNIDTIELILEGNTYL